MSFIWNHGKVLLGTFSTLERVSNGTNFSNFGLVKSEIQFFKDLISKLKFPNLKEMEFFRIFSFPLILHDHFTLDFKDGDQISLVF